MRFPVDLHTHTIASDHAYSTIEECIHRAAAKGLMMFATTDHGPILSDAPHLWHFNNLRVIPRVVDRVCVLRGVESNIMEDGTVDVPEQTLSRLDVVLSGFHPNLRPSDVVTHTDLMLRVIRSGLVDIISHPGTPHYPVDYEAVLECAKQEQVAVEINSSSDVNTRFGSHDNCVKVAELCKKIGTTISLGTDAHVSFFIGDFTESERVLATAGVPDEQIINTSPRKVLRFLEGRGHTPIEEMHRFLDELGVA